MENHYWIKIDKHQFEHLRTRCDLTKTNTTTVRTHNLINNHWSNEKRFKVYGSYGGDQLFIKQGKDFYWLQTDGNPETEKSPLPLEPNYKVIFNTW